MRNCPHQVTAKTSAEPEQHLPRRCARLVVQHCNRIRLALSTNRYNEEATHTAQSRRLPPQPGITPVRRRSGSPAFYLYREADLSCPPPDLARRPPAIQQRFDGSAASPQAVVRTVPSLAVSVQQAAAEGVGIGPSHGLREVPSWWSVPSGWWARMIPVEPRRGG